MANCAECGIASPRHHVTLGNQGLRRDWRSRWRKVWLLAACLLSAAPALASEPIGCILPIYCGDPLLPPCSIECAPLAEFSWFRYCPGHLSDGYVWHPVLGGAYAYRLRQEENGDLTFVTASDELPADGVEDAQCGPWGQRG